MNFSTSHLPTQKELARMEALTSPDDGDTISAPLVMASAAGWYIGHIYKDCYGIGPWSRESEYMTHDTAVALWQYDYAQDVEFEDNIPF